MTATVLSFEMNWKTYCCFDHQVQPILSYRFNVGRTFHDGFHPADRKLQFFHLRRRVLGGHNNTNSVIYKLIEK